MHNALVRRLFAVLASAILSACGCTQVGCGSQLEFDLPFDVQPGATYEVSVCLDGECMSGALRPTETFLGSTGDLTMEVATDVLALDLGQDARGGTRHVTMSVRESDGVELAAMDTEVGLEKYEPNGGWPCGPTCWRAHLDARAPSS